MLPFQLKTRPSFDAASLRLFAAIVAGGGRLTDSRKNLIDKTIVRLKTAGLWTKLDCLYMFAALDSVSALINWKNPGTFNATLVNSPTFAADRGYTGNGTTSYVTSNFNPTSAGGLFTQNSAHGAARCLTAGAATNNNRLLGSLTQDAAATFVLIVRGAADAVFGKINDITNPSATLASTQGHWVLNRSGAIAREIYNDGTSVVADVTASTGLVNRTLTFLHDNATFAALEAASGAFGSSLSATEAATLSAIDLAYMQAVGAV